MERLKQEQTKDKIRECVDEFFSNICKEFKLKSGDLSPLEHRHVQDFQLMLEDYIRKNGD